MEAPEDRMHSGSVQGDTALSGFHAATRNNNNNNDGMDENNSYQRPLPVTSDDTSLPHLEPESTLILEENPVDDLENHPPAVVSSHFQQQQQQQQLEPNDPLASSVVAVVGDGMMDMNLLEEEEGEAGSGVLPLHNDIMSSPIPPSSFVPGPLREEPTLKEKLVDRERQRRKEAERARLKRQFALMSNGEGIVYDTAGSAGGGTGGGGGPASTTGAVRENGSVTGTVGEESTHADLEDSFMASPSPHHHHHHHSSHSSHHHHHQGDQSPQLGYTMERFLQERDATATRTVSEMEQVAAIVAGERMDTNDGIEQTSTDNNMMTSNNNVFREETIEGDPSTAGAPDKGVVMERFLNDPVVVDAPPRAVSTEQDDDDNDDPRISNRPDDAHRSVSFDMELRTALYNDNRNHNHNNNMNIMDNEGPNRPRNTLDTLNDHLHLSIDDSNASVRVEVAPEDDILGPVSPRGRLSVPSEVAPSSLEDHQHHNIHHSGLGVSFESVGPSSSSNGNNDDDTDDEPRVLRLTEAEIQEMAAIEEASIGNAPPSDRDAESLVGELVGEFGTPSAAGDVDPAGTTFSQGTPTTAMESGSMLSGNQMIGQRASGQPTRRGRDVTERRDDGDNHMDDMDDHNSIDDMAISASVSSNLVVSPGASVSGSAVSVTANPPSEIIGRGEPASTLMLDDGNDSDVDDELSGPLPPPPLAVGNASEPLPSSSPPTFIVAENDNTGAPDTVATELECGNSALIREELRATRGPRAEEIQNRKMRPGMMNIARERPHTPDQSQQSSPLRRITSLPEKINSGSSIVDTPKYNRTVEEFDFDKHDLLMTPHSMMSDSIRDLPGDDDFWARSPGTKMTVSPIRQSREQHNQRNTGVDPLLAVPIMAKTEAEASSMKANASFAADQSASNEKSVLPSFILQAMDRAFNDVRANSSSVVEAKESELYDRGSIAAKAFQTRILPSLLTCMIEIPVLLMVSGGSDRLCVLLGRDHQKLLIGFIPLIAGISGTLSSQASSLTTRAISHGHVTTSKTFRDWMVSEIKVAALVGVGLGAAIGILGLLCTSSDNTDKNVAFALTIGIVQFISSCCAGCTGTIAPLFTYSLFRRSARHVGSFLERSAQDVVATFLTVIFSYVLLVSIVSPVNERGNCVA